ncbi:MAG: transposase [Bdellovibrionaceae bacterium]|nr:transposase [Pseudobdellovibrionaceae bacterium]
MARILSVNRKTIVRKFEVLGKICLTDMNRKKHLRSEPVQEFIFDDMETFEHTKLKPLSISMAVEAKTRMILDFRVSSMKAKGHLAAKARKKYGYRADERKKHLAEMLINLKQITIQNPLIKSDMNPHYIVPVKDIFPGSTHEVFKGKRGCVIGQGELKAVGFDPIFAFNHTAAMLRANINRLFRRTWNTTKKPKCLSYHIAIYVFYHNLRLLDPFNNS